MHIPLTFFFTFLIFEMSHSGISIIRGAHGSGTDGYDLEPPVSVLKIVEPKPNREGVSRLRLRFRFRTGGFSVIFLRFFTVSNRRFFAVQA